MHIITIDKKEVLNLNESAKVLIGDLKGQK